MEVAIIAGLADVNGEHSMLQHNFRAGYQPSGRRIW